MVTSEGATALPNTWYASIEKSKEKARKLLKKVVVLDMNDSVIVGVLEDVMIDKLFNVQYPFIKLTLQKIKKYDAKEKLVTKIDEQIFFINKPQMIMDVREFEKKYPNIYQDFHVEMKKGVY